MEKSYDEVLTCHRSPHRTNIAQESSKIDKYCRVIEQIYNFFNMQSRKDIRTFREIKTEDCREEGAA